MSIILVLYICECLIFQVKQKLAEQIQSTNRELAKAELGDKGRYMYIFDAPLFLTYYITIRLLCHIVYPGILEVWRSISFPFHIDNFSTI